MTESEAITLRGVTKRFNRSGTDVVALHELDLTIPAGQFVSVIGPSGCGKSTLLRLVGGLLDDQEGSIAIGGDSPIEARRRKHFGFVPQTPALLDWKTVRQNVDLLRQVNSAAGERLSTADAADQVTTLLDRVGLTDAADAYPRELSGGMQQRVSLARAFLLRAPVMIMDEPFSALDEITRADMRFLLLELWAETRATVLFVTHNIDEAVVLSDRVIVMGGSPGSIVLDQPIDLPRPRAVGVEDSAAFRTPAAHIREALTHAYGGSGQ